MSGASLNESLMSSGRNFTILPKVGFTAPMVPEYPTFPAYGGRSETGSSLSDGSRRIPTVALSRPTGRPRTSLGIGTLCVESALHGEQLPGPGHPVERVLSTICELDTRTDN